jgi:asparagine synthase (glutamine-hydrolysing)
MCGIAGIYRYQTGKEVQPAEVLAMAQLMAYRGPDAQGEYCRGPVGLAHRRLSIIDTSSRSSQPMVSTHGTLTIVFNGEIYNYLELREELVRQGHQFRTQSDTEVILELYREHGAGCLDHLNGMFAFAIWDADREVLFLARDRVGIKPLYYHFDADGIVFASEIKAILAVSSRRPEVDPAALDSYMTLGYVPTDRTMFRGITKLTPGSYLEIDRGQVLHRVYWDIDLGELPDHGETYYVERTRELFRDAVRLQLRSDVPLGVFLSGGLDSSAVVAMMAELGVGKINTFSVAWGLGGGFDETPYAREIARKFDTNHFEYYIDAKDFLGFLESYIWHMDEPVTEAAGISLYYIAKLAKEQVTVVLSGEGSDEVFGGYPIYRYMELLDRYRGLPAPLRRGCLNPLLGLLGEKFRKYVRLSELPLEERYLGVSFYDNALKESLYSSATARAAQEHSVFAQLAPYYQRSAGLDPQRRMQYLDIKTWLVDDLLIKADRMSMAPSLELRVPFLDHRLVELGAAIPAKYRLKNGTCKHIIKKAMEPYLPHDIIHRRKMGFPTPLALLFKGDLKPYARELLSSRRFLERGYFDPDAVKKLWHDHENGTRDVHRVLWQLIVLENWHRKFID